MKGKGMRHRVRSGHKRVGSRQTRRGGSEDAEFSGLKQAELRRDFEAAHAGDELLLIFKQAAIHYHHA